MALTFKEKAGNPEEPGGSGHSMEQQRANGFYLLDSGTGPGNTIQSADILAAITQILGKCAYAAGAGGLNRTLPLYHPLYTWLYATNISRQWGVGQQTPTNAEPPLNSLGTSGVSIAQFALYKQYWFAVDFLPRDYPVVADASIFRTAFTYYDDDDVLEVSKYYPEWGRFTDSTTKPAPANDINLTQFGGTNGTFVFETASGSAPNGVSFPGSFQVLLPNQIVTVSWYNVPLRYIISPDSFIASVEWRNRVNQNPIAFAKITAQPGELLYLGFDYKTFTPPCPTVVPLFNGQVRAPGQLCNIQMFFLYTSRECTDPPSTVTVDGVNTFRRTGNPSRIVNGHNLLYNFARKNYYYAKSSTSGLPSFRSFPMELLFTDPDSVPLAAL